MIEQYLPLTVSLLVGTIYAVISWQLSGEAFDKTKFLRTVLVGFAVAFGLELTDSPLSTVYAEPFVSTLFAVLISKGIVKVQTKAK